MFLRSFLASFRFHFLRYRYMYDLFVFPLAMFCGYTVGAAPLQLSDPDPDRIGFWDCDGDSVAQGCSVCSLVALRCSCCFVRRSSSIACCFPRFCSLTFHHWSPRSSLYSTVTCLMALWDGKTVTEGRQSWVQDKAVFWTFGDHSLHSVAVFLQPETLIFEV